jgi:carbamoyl-phosphate synthase small subunit
MQAFLALEDGRIFRGESYGARRECFGEVVFNTALTGYQEIFTDPSYAGQIVVLTNPQIGNYGTNAADNEASRPYIEGLVTREFSPISSNWRSQQVTEEYLERFNVPVIGEIDTRAVVRPMARCAELSLRSRPILTNSFRRPAASARWMAPIWPR